VPDALGVGIMMRKSAGQHAELRSRPEFAGGLAIITRIQKISEVPMISRSSSRSHS